MPFKWVGLLIIFSVCSAAGLLKSVKLAKRADKLNSIARSVSVLAEHIRGDSREIEQLIFICFSRDTAIFKNGKIEFEKQNMNEEDIALAEEFAKEFGSRDIVGEYERTKMYAGLFKKQGELAEAQCLKLGRLYSTLGVLGGVFICIFLL